MAAVEFDPRVVAAVRRLEVRARRAIRSGLGGAWPSAVRGAGVEFAEVREYVVGDDARTLDWNVTARTGRLQVKRFEEEREQAVVVLLDASRSTREAAGARPWRQAAAELLVLLGSAAALAGDRVGAGIFAQRLERWFPPRHGTSAVLALAAQWLDHVAEAPGTDVGAALAALLRLRARPSLLFLVTDAAARFDDATFARAARRHDLVVLALRAGLLARLPASGRWRFADPEGGAARIVDLGDGRVRAALTARLEGERTAAAARAARLGAEWIELDADGELARPLLDWARRRSARLER